MSEKYAPLTQVPSVLGIKGLLAMLRRNLQVSTMGGTSYSSPVTFSVTNVPRTAEGRAASTHRPLLAWILPLHSTDP